MRLSNAKENRPSLPAKLSYSLAFTSGEAIDQKGNIGLSLLPNVERSLFLVRLIQCALAAPERGGRSGIARLEAEAFGL